MKPETMDKALDLRRKLMEVDSALEQWERWEKSPIGNIGSAGVIHGESVPHLNAPGAWERYRREQIDHLVGKQRELQRSTRSEHARPEGDR